MGISAGGGAGALAAAAAPAMLVLLLTLPPLAAPFSFTYNFTSPSDTPPPGIAFQGDAFYNKAIRLTRDERLGPITSSAGRAFYSRAVPLADPVTRRRASFAAAFAFSIAAPDPASASGDGLAFFLSPFPSALPSSSAGGLLGLFNSSAPRAGKLVAVEFDTYKNGWDPSGDHVGVDLGGIVSAATADCPTSMKDGRTAHARVAYDGRAKNLTVALSYGANATRPNATGDVLLWYAVDLLDYLPDSVAIGFSAATGEAAELHQVLYWEFTSTVDPKEESVILWVVLGLCALLLVLIGAGVVWFVRQWKKAGEFDDGDIEVDDVMGGGGEYDELADEFVVESGPRRFRYAELAAATRNFAEDRKLGQGGFGAPSNVMLDATFGAKLGDFGLAKLVEHGSQPYTTALAGTLGYLAPECVMTGKASRESDVYSFGVVALEIACGRRPAELDVEPSKARLVPWVWELYGKNAILEAADWRLKGQFDEEQMERLMVVGLWCAHPDYAHRPSIRQALNVLKLEAPLPVLPPKMPVPTYFPPLPESMAPISVGGASSTEDPGISDYGSSGKGSSVRDRLLEP
nr:unnamed protein product [Digitaria exilis]